MEFGCGLVVYFSVALVFLVGFLGGLRWWTVVLDFGGGLCWWTLLVDFLGGLC